MSEWKVGYTDGKVSIRSDDFTHDVVLYLTGDFATHEVAIGYAARLATRLNADPAASALRQVERECKAWTEEDQPLPEDEQIIAAHPLHCGRHDLYAEALRLVGAKRSKYALVDLVNWLLLRLDRALSPTPTPTELVDGYVLVPREPSDDMMDAGHEALSDRHKTGQFGECPGLGWSDAEACYRAMIQAAEKGE